MSSFKTIGRRNELSHLRIKNALTIDIKGRIYNKIFGIKLGPSPDDGYSGSMSVDFTNFSNLLLNIEMISYQDEYTDRTVRIHVQTETGGANGYSVEKTFPAGSVETITYTYLFTDFGGYLPSIGSLIIDADAEGGGGSPKYKFNATGYLKYL